MLHSFCLYFFCLGSCHGSLKISVTSGYTQSHLTLGCQGMLQKPLVCPGWSCEVDKRTQDHCNAGVSRFLHHVFVLSSGLCRCIWFVYSASRMRIVPEWFGLLTWGIFFCSTLCRLTYPELLICDSLSIDWRNIWLDRETLWLRLIYLYKYLRIHVYTYVYMYKCIYMHVYVKPVLRPPLSRAQMLRNASSREQRSRNMTKQQSVTSE